MAVSVRRSKGCLTCRKRRIRCDETHPVCLRCTKRGVECKYGEGPTMFVDERPRLEAKAAAQQHYQYIPEIIIPSRGQPQQNIFVPHQVSFSIPSEASLNGHEEQIYFAFLNHRPLLGTETHQDVGFWGYGHGNNGAIGHDSTLQLCYQTLAAAYYGRFHRQQNIGLRARQLYGKALQRLSQELGKPGKAGDPQLPAAVVCLTLYEMITFQAGDGWIKHAGGLERLLQTIGPQVLPSGPNIAIFEFSRSIIMWQDWARRQHCFLDSDEWKTIPYRLITSKPQDLFLNLKDLSFSIPGFVADFERLALVEPSVTNATDLEALCKRLSKTLRDLYEWRWKWELQYSDCVYEVLPSSNLTTAFGSDDKPLFPSLLFFSQLERASEILLYDTLTIIMLAICRRLQLSTDPEMPPPLELTPLRPPSSGMLLLPDGTSTVEQYAIEACRTIDYHRLPFHAGAGALELLAPLRFVYSSLSLKSEECRWLERTCNEIAESMGIEMARYMTRLQDVIFRHDSSPLASQLFRINDDT